MSFSTRRDCIASAALLLAGCGAPQQRELTAQEMPPAAPREFRGAWVASGANIDWPLASPGQAFATLLDGWVRDNPRGRHLWPRLFTSSVALPPRNWGADEIANQIGLLRTRSAQAGGHIHFSMAALMDDRGGVGARLQALNAGAALVPATPWLGATPPAAPRRPRRRCCNASASRSW